MTKFIGRGRELGELQQLLRKKSASLVVIKGRRRIGKTRLAEEFGQEFSHFYYFAGLAPSQAPTAQEQRSEFHRQMLQQKIPSFFGPGDWGNLLDEVADHCKQGKTLVVFDEISWMGHGDSAMLAKLKNTWDIHFKKNPHLILIISGSNSTWIERNLLSDTAFVGRVSYRLTLKELSLPECNHFWHEQSALVSSFDKLKLLAVTGGVPRYLEEMDPGQSAEDNIQRLCFHPDGLLFREFNDIFTDSLYVRSDHYKSIVQFLAKRPARQIEIAHSLGRERAGGDIGEYLDDLCNVGFVTQDQSWELVSGRTNRSIRYRLSDNYIRFYLRYIETNRDRILEGAMHSLPKNFDSVIGLQFENLVLSLSNRQRLFNLLGIRPESVLRANSFVQTETSRRKGCQIDLLIQIANGDLYICEIKFRKDPLNTSVIREVKEKIDRLKRKRSMSCRPVLIHVNGVTDAVAHSDFFVKQIDFSAFLEESGGRSAS